MLQEFKVDISYFHSGTVAAADGSSQSGNEAFVVMCFWLYPDSAVQGLITMQNSAYHN